VERRFPAAAQAYAKLPEGEAAYAYGRAQSALWEGKLDVPAYLMLLAGLPEGSVPYATRLGEQARELGFGADARAETGGGSAGDDVAGALGDAAARMDGLLKQIDDMRRGIAAAQRSAHRLLSDRMVRVFYMLQQSTSRLRNELGDFYLKAGDRDNAIQQYRYVLSVDPSNIDAIYRLGTTSSLAGDWSGALGYYERVYQADPYYENVINVHNRIADEHSATAAATASYFADSSHVSWTAGGRYTVPLASFLGVQAAYEGGSYRSSEQLSNPAYSGGPVTHHVAYASQTASVTLPLSFHRLGLTLSPRVGATLVLESLYFTGDPGTGLPGFPSADLFDPAAGFFDPVAFARGHSAYPFVGLDYAFEKAGAVRVQGSLRYGTYAQTLAEPKTPRAALEGSMGVSPVLSFLSVPVLRDIYLRSYGEIAYLPAASGITANAVGLVAQDIVIPFRLSGPAAPSIAVEGSLYYSDSLTTVPIYEYYSPKSSLTVKGGLSGSLSFTFAGGSSMSFTARAAGGYTSSYDLFGGAMQESALVEASGSLSHTRRGATVGARAAFTASLDSSTGALSYWSLSVGVDLSARVPRLLMPR
jgi:tetratricopeptide (TPR) repeat protein